MHTVHWLHPKYMLLFLCLLPILLLADYEVPADLLNDFGRFIETAPPAGPVRPIAEFEPASQVLIRYPLGIPVALVAHLSNTAQVVCIVASASVQSSASTTFTSGGVNMANVSFMTAASDSYWTRDYGPWFIFDGNDNYGLVDFQYNRPRPNDNLIPQVFATQMGLTYYGMSLYQTGGNFMSDGINTGAQTTIAYTENSSLTQAQVNAKMLAYMGISSYHVRPDPNDTYIDHIDCWGKFLAPDKVLIRSVPTSHAQYNAIEQAAAYFANLNCAWGYPYKVYRVNTPQNQPYTNSLILNKKVFVPIMNSSYDAAALQVYQTAMPGYEIIGIVNTTSNPWESTDALHCRAHEIPDSDMLEIVHMPYWGTLSSGDGLDFNVTVKAHSGQQVYADSVFVCYKVNQNGWQTSILTNISGNSYTTLLNSFAPGDTIRYYIHAADQSGRSQNHPYFADLDPHIFVVEADLQAPVIVHAPITEIQNQPTIFTTHVTDNSQVATVLMRYKTNQSEVSEVEMTLYPEAGENVWSYTLNPEFGAGDTDFFYQFEASDNANPANTTLYPVSEEWISVLITGVGNIDDLLPSVETEIMGVFPNPFLTNVNSTLSIDYKTIANTPLVLKIFNTKGQLIATQNAVSSITGLNKLLWNGLDSYNNRVATGIYFLQVSVNSKTMMRKVLVLN